MPQPNKIPKAFAASGDRNIIPESTGTLGLASWNEGFPAITSVPFAEGGIAPKRADFNGIFNALSLATVWQQQGGFYAYDATTDYEVGNVVEYNNDLYKCITANGPGSAVKAPTDTTVWSKVMTATDAAALYLPLSGGSISGSIIQTDSLKATLKFSNTTGRLTIGGGTAYNTGAFIWLFGKDHATAPGIFQFDANDGNQYARLLGKPDGTLTWGGASSNYKNIAMREDGVLANMFFSQTSGSYTAPYTGVYRITLKGGGGGGAGVWEETKSCGGGGGEGSTLIFYATLVKNQSYPYVIGAGGSAGNNPATSTADIGTEGGTSSFNAVYTASGGRPGQTRNGAFLGGLGGLTYQIPSGAVAHFIPGASGQCGNRVNVGDYLFNRTAGGGGNNFYNPSSYGGGGCGGGASAPNAGGAGYILIEYAG